MEINALLVPSFGLTLKNLEETIENLHDLVNVHQILSLEPGPGEFELMKDVCHCWRLLSNESRIQRVAHCV